ncbi:type II secretion system protein N [Hahella chejuensis]|uniref:type II secretion system protein N n=1 Tax=Hahella chejuensis TaxID=158327 RepID=UPI000322E7FF|nr:type II secretion system protein N [Hahella chejuensis]
MIKKIVGLVIIGGLTYLAGLVLLVPVEFVWRQAGVPANQLPVRVQKLQGTLWEGKALISHSWATGVLDWDVYPSGLLLMGDALALNFRANKIDIDAKAALDGFDQVRVLADGSLDLAALAPALRRHRLNLSGELKISGLDVTLDTNTGLPVRASGRAQWAGGPVTYPMGRENKTATMPPLQGLIKQEGEEIHLEVLDSTENKPVMSAQVTRDGTAKIQIRKRLLDLAGAPWSKQANPDDIVFRVQQRIL